MCMHGGPRPRGVDKYVVDVKRPPQTSPAPVLLHSQVTQRPHGMCCTYCQSPAATHRRRAAHCPTHTHRRRAAHCPTHTHTHTHTAAHCHTHTAKHCSFNIYIRAVTIHQTHDSVRITIFDPRFGSYHDFFVDF